jgi:putative addiction module CopG family antidote
MTIHLKPELEELIKQDIRRGAYQSIDEYVEHAVFMLHEQETWLADHRSEIGTKIDAGYAAAQRGELIDPDQFHSSLEDRKRAWLAGKRKG